MKFFVPGTKDDAHGERLYESIRQYNSQIEGMNSRRIFAIDYLHNGINFHNEVGRPDPKIDDVVLAILETDCYYCVCTINRGVVRGEPILVDPNEVVSIAEFDTED